MDVARMKLRESKFVGSWLSLVERVVSVDVDQNINVKRYPRKSYKHDAVPIDKITTGEDQEQMRLRDSHRSSMTDMCEVNTSSGGLSQLQGFSHQRFRYRLIRGPGSLVAYNCSEGIEVLAHIRIG